MPKKFIVEITGAAPYSSSKLPESPKQERESYDDYEARIWPEKAHTDALGNVTIPAQAFKKALDAAASRRGDKLKGAKTFAKVFKSGLGIYDDLATGQSRADMIAVKVFCDAGGGKGGKGTRVWRTFPVLKEWKGELEIFAFDDAITKPVLERHLTDAGMFIGVGRWRTENGGNNGRFKAKVVREEEV